MDIGKGSKDIAYVKDDQLCCTESEDMVVKSIKTTTAIYNTEEVGNVVIWMEVDPPVISELNLVDEDLKLIQVLPERASGKHSKEKPTSPIPYGLNKRQ